MYEFWECTWDEARLPICLWLEGLFPTVHITGRTFFPNSTWDEVWPPNCLWLSIIGRTFFPNSTWDEDEDVYTVVSPWWGYLYNCVSSQFSPQLDIVSQTQTVYGGHLVQLQLKSTAAKSRYNSASPRCTWTWTWAESVVDYLVQPPSQVVQVKSRSNSASPRWTWTSPELPEPGSVRYTSATVRLILMYLYSQGSNSLKLSINSLTQHTNQISVKTSFWTINTLLHKSQSSLPP